jgi:HD-like signal output (HDOD) protein
MICMRRRVEAFEDAFLAGLLHDIGIVLEDQHAHVQFTQMIHSLREDRTLATTEREHLGFDHATIGGKLAEKWGFPENVTAAIRWHHTAVGYRGESVDIVRCVEVANLLCTAKGISSVGMKLVKPSAATMASLALTRQDVIVLAEDLERELSANASLFTL